MDNNEDLNEINSLKKEAYELKQKGDEELKASKYDEAKKCYSEAILIIKRIKSKQVLSEDELNVLIKEIVVASNLNLSFIDIKQGNWSEAINHSSKVLFVDKNNTKALYRRCLGYINNEDFDNTIVDLTELREKLGQSSELKSLESLYNERLKKSSNDESNKMYKKMSKHLRQVNKSIEYENKGKFGKKVSDISDYINNVFNSIMDCLFCRRKKKRYKKI